MSFWQVLKGVRPTSLTKKWGFMERRSKIRIIGGIFYEFYHPLIVDDISTTFCSVFCIRESGMMLEFYPLKIILCLALVHVSIQLEFRKAK